MTVAKNIAIGTLCGLLAVQYFHANRLKKMLDETLAIGQDCVAMLKDCQASVGYQP